MIDYKGEDSLSILETPQKPRSALSRRRRIALRWLLRVALVASASFALWNLAERKRVLDAFDFSSEDWAWDLPSDIQLDSCVPASTWSVDPKSKGNFLEISETSFDIPLSTPDTIFLLARGSLARGSVELATSAVQPNDTVTFHISAAYHRKYIRDFAKACSISRPGLNDQGVGIFTPTLRDRRQRPDRQEDNLFLDTKIVFPESSSIKGFQTDVENTAHFVGYLDSKVTFEHISLKGSNGPIEATALAAKTGSLATTNGSIRGYFNTSTSLSLITSNAPIDVVVALLSDSTETRLEAVTNNGELNARLHLTSTTGVGGKFNVTTHTSNGAVHVGFSDAPLQSTLYLDAKTENSLAHVTLHPSYEGGYRLAISRKSWFRSPFKADVKYLPGVDPSGKGRRRISFSEGSNTSTNGSTAWGLPPYPNRIPWSGNVNITSSEGDACLYIVSY